MAHAITPPFSVIVTGASVPTGGFDWSSQQLNLEQGQSYDLRTVLTNGTGLEPLCRLFEGTPSTWGITLVKPYTLQVAANAPLGTHLDTFELVAQVSQIDSTPPDVPANIRAFGEGSASGASKGLTHYKVSDELEHFNGMYWTDNKWGGSWKDKNGLKQGPVSWAPSVLVPTGTAEVTRSFDAKALVDAHLAGTPNYGWMIQTLTVSQVILHSKEAAAGKQKPTLRINGTLDILPEADTYTAPASGGVTSANPNGALTTLIVNGFSAKNSAFLFFNLQGITGPINTAELIVGTTTFNRTLQIDLKLMRIDLDDQFVPAPYDATGFSSSYNLDVNLKSHPDCVFAFDFRDFTPGYSTANDTLWNKGGWGATTQFSSAPNANYPNGPLPHWAAGNAIRNAKVIVGLDPDHPTYRPIAPDVPAVRTVCPGGRVNDPCFIVGNWYFHGNLGPTYWDTYNQARGTPAGYGHEPDEIWFRYALYFGEDWDPNPQGGKFFGGFWMVYTAPQSGTGSLDPPRPGGPWALLKSNAPPESGNSGSDGFGCSGSSRRGRFHPVGLGDTPMHKAGFRSVGTIAEDAVGCTTETDVGGFAFDRTYGFDRYWGSGGWLLKGTWNIIEHRIKMNSIATDGSVPGWAGYPFGYRFMTQAEGNATTGVVHAAVCSGTGTSNTIVLNSATVSRVISAADTWTTGSFFIPAENVGTFGSLNAGGGLGRNIQVIRSGTWTGTITVQRSADGASGWTDYVISPNTMNPAVNGTSNVPAANGAWYYRVGFKAGNYTSGSATLSLVNEANDTNGYYNNHAVYMTSRPTELRRIIAYNGATKVATISSNLDSTDGGTGTGTQHLAANLNLSTVQALVASSSVVNGDTILLPDGTATWTGGVTTTKQIFIRAQNYTPTPAGTSGAGATTRSVKLNNACPAGTAMFQFTSGNSFHVGVAGIAFQEDGTSNTTARGPHLAFTGTGTKPPLVNDCFFQVRQRNFPAGSPVVINCAGGVIWNCYFSSLGFNWDPANGPGTDGFGTIQTKPPRAWTTASTMGTLDTGGIVNLYVEDCTFYISAKFVDLDDGGRAVYRHCYFEGTQGVSHGFTSLTGGRHIEIYDCEFWNNIDGSHPHAIGGVGRNYGIAYWVRGGTLLMTNNFIDNNNTGFGTPGCVIIGDNTAPSGTYLIPRQPGAGHNGSASVSDPIYVWNHTGTSPYNLDYNDQPGGWESFVQSGRDIFMNAGAKPGYTKYTYPHPLRAATTSHPTTWTGGVPQLGEHFSIKRNTSIRQRATFFYGNGIGRIYADENSVINTSHGGAGDTAILESDGVGRQDGVHQVWVNGRLAMNEQNEEWRCIYNVQIQAAYITSFMGGQVQTPTQNNTMYFALLACGKSRIGHPGGLL